MDYFEEKEKEKREKAFFVEKHKKSMKIVRIILSSIFGGLGVLFLITGVIGLFLISEKTFGIVFISIGSLYLIMGIVFFIVFGNIDSNKVYERYNKRIKAGKFIYNTNELSMRVLLLEKRVEELEEKINSLK